MRICIEESTYEGTPIEILAQLRAMHFDAGTFDGTEGYIRYMQNTIRRMTEQPCEASLDRYEGYPRLYIKQTLEVRTFDGQRVPVMAYIMNPELHLKPSLPPRDYYLGIKVGYEQNGLPVGCLKYAFKNCLKECGIEPYPKKVQTKPPQRKEASHER